MRIVFALSITACFFLGVITYAASAATEEVKIDIPDYTVERRNGYDYVEIPGGSILMREEGRPMVPYYIESIDYPKGYRIQDVTLKDRGGLEITKGLNLTAVVFSINATHVEMIGGWYPKENYSWDAIIKSNGNTTLNIYIYPFYYNPDITEVRFYRNYTFEVEYIITEVAITSLEMDKQEYNQGDKITIDMEINNSGASRDIVVSVVVKEYGTDRIIDGLPLKTLRDFTGKGSYSVEWNTSDMEPGYYYVEVTLEDTSGDLLDTRTKEFYINALSGEVQRYEKERISFSLEFILYSIITIVIIVSLVIIVLSRRKRRK